MPAPRHRLTGFDLDQLRRRAKELLRDYRAGEEPATADFRDYHPRGVTAADAKLADAQLVYARSHGVRSWPRLLLAAQILRALRDNDVEAVRALVIDHPELLHEHADGTEHSNWGPPMSFAANLGHDAIIRMLKSLGAEDAQHAFDRACLQGKIDTARWLLHNGARLERGVVMGACETLNASGLKFLLDFGAELCDEQGDRLAPVALLLQTYSRSPEGKHRCLELVAEHGVELPDTPVMAFHRGRIDTLEAHLRRDPDLPNRRFSYRDLYPLEFGCHEEDFGLHGTPLDGTTLLHMAVDFDEMEIARWLIEQGADVNARAEVDSDGFGGHTPLFNAVVCQATVCGRQRDASMTRLLLERGADPAVWASVRKRLRFVEDESMHEFHDMTPAEYAEAFHEPRWVNRPGLERIAAWRGGSRDGK